MNIETWFNKVLGWIAHPDWYNYDHTIYLKGDRIVFSSAEGQAARPDCTGKWTVKEVKKNKNMEHGILSIEYKEKGKKDIPYTIYKGDFVTDGHYNKFQKQFFEYKITFKKDPFSAIDYSSYFDYYPNYSVYSDLVFYGDTNSERKKRIEKELRDSYKVLTVIDYKRRQKNMREECEEYEPEHKKRRRIRKNSWFSTLYDEKIHAEFNDV